MELRLIKTNVFCRVFGFVFSFIFIFGFFAASCSLPRNFSNHQGILNKKNFVKNLQKNSLKQKMIRTLLSETGDFKKNKIKRLLELGYDLNQFQLKAFDYIEDRIKELEKKDHDKSPSSLRNLLTLINLNHAFNLNEKLLLKIESKKEFLEEKFPDLDKEISFYFDNVEIIKHDFKSDEVSNNLERAKKTSLGLIKRKKKWLLQDSTLFELKKYFFSNVKLNKLKIIEEKKELFPNFIPLENLEGIFDLREKTHLLGLNMKYKRRDLSSCQKVKVKSDEGFCQFDLFIPLFIKIQENSLSLLHFIKDKNKKNEPLNKKDIPSFFEVVSLNYKFEKLLREIKNKNLNAIKKIKINHRLGIDSKKRLLLNQAFLELLNFHYEMNDLLNIEYAKQKENYDLNDAVFVRVKMEMLKINKKIKLLKRALSSKTRSRLDVILKAKGSKLKNKGRVEYINLLLGEVSTFRKEKTISNKKDILKVRSVFLNSLRKKLGFLIYEQRGKASFFWTKELDNSKDFSERKNRKYNRSAEFIKNLKPLYIILGKFEKPAPYVSLEKNYWDHVGVFLGFNRQLLDLGFNPKKGPYFWRKDSILEGKNLLTILDDKARVMSVNNYGKMFQDIMVLKYERGLGSKYQRRALWKDAIDLDGKKYKTEIDLLAQGKTIHGKMVRDLFPNLSLKEKKFWRSLALFPGQIASLVGLDGPLKPVYISFNGKQIKGNEKQLIKFSKCFQDFYCQEKLFQKIKEGDDYLLWLQGHH